MNYLYPVKEEYFELPPPSSSSSPMFQTGGDGCSDLSQRFKQEVIVSSGFSSESHGCSDLSKGVVGPWLIETCTMVARCCWCCNEFI